MDDEPPEAPEPADEEPPEPLASKARRAFWRAPRWARNGGWVEV